MSNQDPLGYVARPRYLVRNKDWTGDIYLDVAIGSVPGLKGVNKFGYAPLGIQTSSTYVWDDAAATPTWPKPTAAVQHNIASTSGLDVDTVGTGAWKVQIYGLTSWDTAEESEIVSMSGVANVLTAKSYVIIHRMIVIEFGINVNAPNVGVITATTNDGFATVTAQINVSAGQTQMAVYGIPSIQTAYMTNWYASIQKASGVNVDCNFSLVLNPFPANPLQRQVTKETRGLQTNGNTNGHWPHEPNKPFVGPCILAITGISSAANLDATAGFDLILRDN